MSTSLKDKVIIVTGGTGRLGTAVTSLLLARGADVTITYNREAELARLYETIPAEHKTHLTAQQVDVTNEKSVEVFIAGVKKASGRIDGLANLVGGWDSTPFTEMTIEKWQQQIDLNLKSAFLMTHAVVPHMVAAKYGRILGVGAQSAMQARAGQAHYNVSKVGVMWLMETISNEVKEFGVTANAILPSAIKTKEEHAKDPGGAWVRPEEIAELVAYLLSPESGATSGAKIPVYGKK